jgi:hypothetical protein
VVGSTGRPKKEKNNNWKILSSKLLPSKNTCWVSLFQH